MLRLIPIISTAVLCAAAMAQPPSAALAVRSQEVDGRGSSAVAGAKVYSPFDAASLAPTDVTVYIHVDHASRIRKELADRPIARWINGILANGGFSDAWTRLARAAKLNDGELFDFVMGERFTLLVRDGQTPAAANRGATSEWALVTGVDQAKASQILRELNVRVHEPRSGFAIAELPEQDILIARDEHHMVVGSVSQSRLFYEMLPRVGGKNEHSLASEPCFAEAHSLRIDGGAGCAAVFLRHPEPMGGGWSLALADVKGDHLAIAHSAHFDRAPFMHRVTSLACDCSPVKAFEDRALVAMIQPTDIGEGPLETFISATLHEGMISRAMRQNRGDREMMIVGEQAVRQNDKPIDMLTPTLVTCVELKDKAVAAEQLDRQMLRLTRQINNLKQGSLLADTSELSKFQPGEPRHIDLSPAMADFGGGFPIMKSISLNWTVADGPNGTWFVVASHPQSMREVVKTLQSPCEPDARFKGRFDSAGTANGARLGKHVENLSDQVQQLAQPDKVESVRMTLKLMSQLAAGCQTCRWQLERQNANDMRLNVQVTLTPPDSSR